MSTAASDLIVTDVRGDYAIITINREDKRNAMNRVCRDGLKQAFANVAGRCKVVILTGTGRSFCAGIDLTERVSDEAEGRDSAIEEWIDVNVAIREHPAIFIAAVNGLALGGGATLVNVCDLAIASDAAQIGMPELGFATYPGLAAPSTQLTITRKRAAWMIFTTDRIGGTQAAEWGLVNMCVPAERLMEEAVALAERVAQFDAVALTGSKIAIDRIPAAITDWRQGFSYGQFTNAWIRSRTKAQGEGLRRFNAGKKNPGQG
jgi:enoyl-CoA hydratase/carnithine racemase